MLDSDAIFSAIAPRDPRRIALEPLRTTFLERNTRGQRYLDDGAWLEAYRAFFFPQTFAKVASVLEELGAFSAEHVVDLGSAMAPAAFAAAAVLDARTLHAVDFSQAALQDANAIAKRVSRTLHTHHHDLARGWPKSVPEKPDLVLACNALSEIERFDDRVSLVSDILANHLSERGALVLIEPADHAHARDLQRLRDRLRPLSPVSPCPHAAPCPALERERDFCHVARKLPLPAWFGALSKRAGLSDERMRFSYLVYRSGVRTDTDALRILSHPIVEKGRRRYFACHRDGLVELMRQNKHAEPINMIYDKLEREAEICVTGGSKTGRSPILWKVDPETEISVLASIRGNLGQTGLKS